MKNRDNKLKIVLIFILSAFFSNFFHEFGHWIVGEILGNDLLISINQVRLEIPMKLTPLRQFKLTP